MTKFIKFANTIMNTQTHEYFYQTEDLYKNQFNIHCSINPTRLETFNTEQERDARWQELESMLLDVTSLAQKDSVPKLSQKETKTYYIGIYKSPLQNYFITNQELLETQLQARCCFPCPPYEFIKTIEVEL